MEWHLSWKYIPPIQDSLPPLINKFLTITDKKNIESVKDKIRLEITKGLNKDKILNEEDKILLYDFYLKIKDEFKGIEKK